MRHARMKAGLALAAAGLLGLGACSRSDPDPPYTENAAAEESPAETASPTDIPSAEPVPAETRAEAANSAAIDVPPEAPVAPDKQVLDDADATGMTARVSRDEAPANDQAEQ